MPALLRWSLVCRRQQSAYKELEQRKERHESLSRVAERMRFEKQIMVSRRAVTVCLYALFRHTAVA